MATNLATLSQAEKCEHDIFTKECAERAVRLKPARDLLKTKTSVEIRDMLKKKPNQNLSDQLNEAVKVNKEIAAKEQVVMDRVIAKREQGK